MNNQGNIAFLAVIAVFLIFILTWRPESLSDQNDFVKDFTDKEVLAFMGVILTLSIGLLAQLFLSVAKLGEKLGKEVVTEIRDELKSTAKTLVYIFFACIALVITHPSFFALILVGFFQVNVAKMV